MADNQHPVIATPEVGFDHHEPRTGVIALVSTVTIVVLILIIVGVYYLYMVAYESVEYQQYTGVASKELQAIHDREEEQLNRYAYINKEKGVVRIPIDRAMEIVASEFEQGKVFYNTTPYPVKPEPPGGAAGGLLNPPQAAPSSAPPASDITKPSTPNAQAAH